MDCTPIPPFPLVHARLTPRHPALQVASLLAVALAATSTTCARLSLVSLLLSWPDSVPLTLPTVHRADNVVALAKIVLGGVCALVPSHTSSWWR